MSTLLQLEEKYWVQDPVDVWLPCTLKSLAREEGAFLSDDGKLITVPSSKLASLDRVEARQLAGVDDICSLPQITEGAVLHTVRERYMLQQVYTRVSRVLIALNPYRSLPLYSSIHIDMYKQASDSLQHPPHIFGLTQDALRGLRYGSKSHVILISGDSGAGKTESAKLILSFVAEAGRSADGVARAPTWGSRASNAIDERMEENMLRCSPILESFGNAMTVRNNNSSRFGKWLDIRFPGSGGLKILSSSVTSYLLETTRVCTHGKFERSFHVFYQLLKRRTMFPWLQLQEAEHYRYLRGGVKVANGIDDAARFHETLDSFGPLGFDEKASKEIFRIIAGVLNIGNIDFRNQPGETHLAELDDQAGAARTVSELLGVNVDDLQRCMLRQTMVLQGQEIETQFSVAQACAIRDTLAKLIYGHLFAHIVAHVNTALSFGWEATDSDRSLGVLDIAGFESFEINTFEQLLINLTNEHLQQSFNDTIIKSELEDYEKEGIKLQCVLNFKDNLVILNLLDGKGGVFDLLDEECALPKGTDSSYSSKVAKANGGNAGFVQSKFGGVPKFGIRHFAGEVTYTCTGFLEKNAQKMPEQAIGLLASSELKILQQYGEALAEAAEKKKGPGPATRKKPLSSSLNFRQSLRTLMQKIKAAERHYVRCVKPNKVFVPDRFDAPMVMEQLLFSGVVEAVKIRHQGFSMRLPFEDFVRRYRCLLGKTDQPGAIEASDLVAQLVAPRTDSRIMSAELSAEDIVVGKTKVLVRAAGCEVLEEGRSAALAWFAVRIQATFKMAQTRRRMKSMLGLSGRLEHALKQLVAPDKVRNGAGARRDLDEDAERLTRRLSVEGDRPPPPPGEESEDDDDFVLRRCSSIVQDRGLGKQPVLAHGSLLQRLNGREAAIAFRAELTKLVVDARAHHFEGHALRLCEEAVRRLDQELDCEQLLVGLTNTLDATSIEKAAARAKGLGLTPPRALVDRGKKLQTQVPLLRAMEEVMTAGPQEDEEERLLEIVQAVRQAGLSEAAERWLPELDAAVLLQQVMDRHEELDEKRRAREEERHRLEREQAAAEEAARQKEESATALEEARAAEKAALEKAREQEAVQRRQSQKMETERAKRRSTITGFVPEETLHSLQKAVMDYDAPALEALLRQANDNGVQSNDLIAAKLIFAELQTEAFVAEALAAAEADCREVEPQLVSLARLRNLGKQLRRLRGDDPELTRAARRSVAVASTMSAQRSLRRRARSRKKHVTFEEVSRENSQDFTNLLDFPALKPARTWRGYRQTMTAAEAARLSSTAPAPMLSHSKATIQEALTYVPLASERLAIQCFRDVQTWMTDWPAQDCQRQSAKDAVLRMVRTKDELRDEVYIQLLKQLTDNRSEKSRRLGWKLLYFCCLSVPPSDQLAPYLQTWLHAMEASAPTQEGLTEAEAEEISQQAEMCMDALEALQSLPRLQGHLWKKSTCKFRLSGWDWRYFCVRNMQMYWFRTCEDASTPEAAGPVGGPLCKGHISLLANDCEVVSVDSSPDAFTIRAVDGAWKQEYGNRSAGTSRVFYFDASGTNFDSEDWLDVLRQHIDRSRLVREQLDSHERVPSLHYLVLQIDVPVELTWRWASNGKIFGSKNPLRWSFPRSLEAAGGHLQKYIGRPEADRPISLEITSKSRCPPYVSEEITVGNLREALAIIRELLDVRNRALGHGLTSFVDDGMSINTNSMCSSRPQTASSVEAEAATVTSVVDTTADGPRRVEWQVGDIVYYWGHTSTLPDGSELKYGACGRIAVINEDNRMGVRFAGVKFRIGCAPNDVSKTPPPNELVEGWEVGQKAWYKGGGTMLENGTGVEILYGACGEVIGPAQYGSAKTPKIAVRFEQVQQGISIRVSDLSMEPPELILSAGWTVGDYVCYRGNCNAFGDKKLESGAIGLVVGPDMDDKKRVVVRFEHIASRVSCRGADLQKADDPASSA
eukprot:TRINITY_DN14148_c0_g1_i1.p1 TRINITY_DN14148_c0_g1~~TRINITY_DN14148_c0_g1_i1.p1  ORF type:complete len:1947 (+),score=476.92 TRINITY_DN14148_c0_g1_i1:170-6010(+)